MNLLQRSAVTTGEFSFANQQLPHDKTIGAEENMKALSFSYLGEVVSSLNNRCNRFAEKGSMPLTNWMECIDADFLSLTFYKPRLWNSGSLSTQQTDKHRHWRTHFDTVLKVRASGQFAQLFPRPESKHWLSATQTVKTTCWSHYIPRGFWKQTIITLAQIFVSRKYVRHQRRWSVCEHVSETRWKWVGEITQQVRKIMKNDY